MPGPHESITRSSVSLRSGQLDALRGLARATGAPLAELTRRAVDAYLAARVPGYVPGSQLPEPALYEPAPTPLMTRA
jgi:hypothetical protein